MSTRSPTGFVIQVFDTELQEVRLTRFTAGDDCQYEDKDGEPVDSEALNGAYLPFDMVQPMTPDERNE